MKKQRIRKRGAAVLLAVLMIAFSFLPGKTFFSLAENAEEEVQAERTAGSEEELSLGQEEMNENDVLTEEKETEALETSESELEEAIASESEKPEDSEGKKPADPQLSEEEIEEVEENSEKTEEDGEESAEESEDSAEETEDIAEESEDSFEENVENEEGAEEDSEETEESMEETAETSKERFEDSVGLRAYFRSHLDPSRIPAVTKMEFVDFLDYRLSFVESACFKDANGDGKTDLLDVLTLPDFYAHIMTLPGITMFYDLNEESPYVAALLPAARDISLPFAGIDYVVNNNSGIVFPGKWHYDANTHILYAAKEWFRNTAMKGIGMTTRAQPVFLYNGDDFSLCRTVPVTSSVDQGKEDPYLLKDHLFSGNVSAGLMNEEGIRFRLFEGELPISISKSSLNVYINGERSDSFSYDPVSHLLSVSFPLLSLSDVHVDVKTGDSGARLFRSSLRLAGSGKGLNGLLSYVTKDIFSTPLEMKQIPAEGDTISFEHAVWVKGSNGNHLGNAIAIRYDKDLPEERFDWDFTTSPVVGYFKDIGTAIDALKYDPETVIRFLSDKTAFGAYGSPNEPYPVTACYDFQLSGAMRLNGKDAALLPEGSLLQLYCTHATYADAVAHGLRDINLQMDGAVNGSVLKVSEPGADGIGYIYAAFGSNDFGNLNNGYVQAQFGVGRFPYRVQPAIVSVKKESERKNVTENNALYSVQGIRYGIYSDEDCKELLKEVEIREDGTSEEVTLSPGTYFLRESFVPGNSGYLQSEEVKKAVLSGGENKMIVFRDEPLLVSLGLEIEKTDADGVEIPGYEKSGAVFRIDYYAGATELSDTEREADAGWEIETKKDADGKRRAVLDQEHLISGEAIYGVHPKNGRFQIPLGIVKIREVKAPAAYVKEGVRFSLSGIEESAAEEIVIRIGADSGMTVLQVNDSTIASDRIVLTAAEEKKVPAIRTKASSCEFESDHIEAISEAKLKDLVTLRELIPGMRYELSGVLRDAADGSPIAEAQLSFSALSQDEERILQFEADLFAYAGKCVVITEELYYIVPEEETEGTGFNAGDKILVASHEDLLDPEQTVYLPSVSTKAKDEKTGTQHAFAESDMKILDEVLMEGLKKGESYRIEGVLMDAEKETPALDDEGNEIRSVLEFTAEESTEKKIMEYAFSGSGLAGKKLVVYEKLFLKDQCVARHEDPKDPDQSVDVPALNTRASNRSSGEKEVPADQEVEIVDLVSYKGLVPGEEYLLKAVLVDQKNGESLKKNGEEVMAAVRFTPEKSEGKVEVPIRFDSAGLKDRALVVFESCYHKDQLIAVHHDIESEAQTVYVKRPPSRTVILGIEKSLPLFFMILPAISALAIAAGCGLVLLLKRRSN